MKSLLINQQQPIVLIIGYVLVAGLAFSLGRMSSPSATPPEIRVEEAFVPLNNTAEISIEQSQNPVEPAQNAGAGADSQPAGGSEPGNCAANQIKGNIGSSNSRVYHLPGGSFYNRTVAEMCFNTETEAQAAGFRKSSR